MPEEAISSGIIALFLSLLTVFSELTRRTSFQLSECFSKIAHLLETALCSNVRNFAISRQQQLRRPLNTHLFMLTFFLIPDTRQFLTLVRKSCGEVHAEVLDNLNCIHGALLRMNRSIQAEGAFGGIKWNRSYASARRRGLEGLLLETTPISCGFNFHKFHLKSHAKLLAA